MSLPVRRAAQTPRPRIVQHRNRRYSIRLEPVFWQALEALAARRGVRLGRLVAELAAGYAGNNFASHLRVACMLELTQALARASLRPGQGGAVELVLASGSPGLVLSPARTILACNEAFERWLGAPSASLLGAELTAVLQVRTRRPLNELWAALMAGSSDRVEANVLYVEPGRVLAAPARFLAVRPGPEEAAYAVLWLLAGPAPPRGALAPAPGAPQRAPAGGS